MIREVDLVSYLPPFMAEYKEINAALTAENPEFGLLWQAADRTLKNEFIATADEYGISRFEKILGIYPADTDSIEDRRMKVQNKWFHATPYTIRMLAAKMAELLGGAPYFSVWTDFEKAYELKLTIHNTEDHRFHAGHMEEVKYLLEVMVPLNIRCRINDRTWMEISAKDREQILIKNIQFRIAVPYLPFRAYDGTSRYNGKTRYDAKRRYKLGAGIRLKARIREPEEAIRNVTVETRRNVQYYNGKKCYDGTRRYHAMIRKDVIE